MHYKIRIITKAENEDQAYSHIENFCEDLIERGEFDWYDTDGRWGRTKPVELSSTQGTAMAKEALESTRSEFDEALAAVKSMLSLYNADEIFSESFGTPDPKSGFWPSRYQFTRVGGDKSYLYASNELWGGSIRNNKEYEEVTKDPKNLWIAIVDFHN